MRAPARRVGRPRADPRRRRRRPGEEILFVAAKLFAQQGFAATSTRQIANAAGLRQPSLFHHYPTKEAMLEALLERSLAGSLAFVEGQVAARGRRSVRLYRAIAFDVRHLCSFPFDLTAVVLSPEARGRRFKRFWKRRDRLIAGMRTLIRAGIRAGELRRVDPQLTTAALVGMSEATLSWYARRGRWTPDEVADHVASLALRALLRHPAQLDAIRRAAQLPV